MKLPPDFQKSLVGKTDEELYAVLAEPQDYLPEALDAVQAELRHRDLPNERVTQVQSTIEAKRAEATRIAEMPLAGTMRLLIFLGICATIWLPLYYRATGYKRKASERWKWLFYAVLFWTGLGILAAIVNRL